MPLQQEVDQDVQYPGALDPSNPVDDKVLTALFSIVEQVEIEELTSQDRAVQEAKRRDMYWRGIQAVFWNETARAFEEITPQTTAEAEAIAKVVNVYKADGESIAAAIASSVPAVRFFPEDADNPDDISAAKASTRLSEKIAKDNEASMLMFQIMFTLWNEPFAAAHICYVEDPSFGYRTIPTYEKQIGNYTYDACANCGQQMGPGSVPSANGIEPDMGMDMEMEGEDPLSMMQQCPDCGGTETAPMTEQVEFPVKSGEVELPEGRAVIEIYGISNVRIPFYCRTQEDIGYVFLDSEQHYSILRNIFKHIKDKIQPGSVSSGDAQKVYREPQNSTGEAEVATCRRVWLRPWLFDILDEETHAEELAVLRERFPDGVLLMYVNNTFACAFPEGIDKVWEFTKHPMSRYIHNIPLGEAEIPLQDMTNEATNLSMDLILNSVPPTFVNPDVVNFNELGDTRQLPGTWIKARPKVPGMPLDVNFYTPKPPTMSQYLPQFFAMLDARRQHVGGAFPSIYGGPASGSKTKGEYEQSRSQALQRLGIVWKIINIFWPNIMGKAVRILRENLTEDIKDVRRAGNDFVNVWIRKSEMTGKVGRVESESSEEFPVAWSQIRSMLFELMGMGIPQVNEALLHPENVDFMKKMVGMPELYIPGEDDRRYQLTVIQQLVNSAPMAPMVPSVPPEQYVGDNNICIQVTQAWVMSEQGMEARETNPEGFQNVIFHLLLRLQQQQQEMAQQAMMAGNGAPPNPAVPSPQGSAPKPPPNTSAGPPAKTQ